MNVLNIHLKFNLLIIFQIMALIWNKIFGFLCHTVKIICISLNLVNAHQIKKYNSIELFLQLRLNFFFWLWMALLMFFLNKELSENVSLDFSQYLYQQFLERPTIIFSVSMNHYKKISLNENIPTTLDKIFVTKISWSVF